MESRGVIIFNVGTKMLVKLIVCLRTLRKHYQGNISLVLGGPHDEFLPPALKKEFGVDIILLPGNDDERALLKKMRACRVSPYDISMFLDSDTVVMGDISEMFELARGKDLVATHFAGWSSSGKTVSHRIDNFSELKPEYIAAAKAYGPAINTGVFAWSKESKIFDEWIAMTKWGFDHGVYIADEVACQTLLPRYDCVVADKKYNVSVLHDPGTSDPRIVHFHGRKTVIEAPKCSIWLQEFLEACRENTCDIKRYIEGDCRGDKRLRRFLYGNNATIHAAVQKEIRQALGLKIPEMSVGRDGFRPDELTIVTACDKKYVEHLRLTFPNWMKHKKLGQYPMIVYVNGFRRPRRNSELDFLRVHGNIRIIEWDMPEAESQRERMLSAFVIGAARDVVTPYWLKIDADAFATDNEPILTKEMRDYAICGHKWGYSFAKHMNPLIEWANAHPAFKDTPHDMFDPTKVDGKRYRHERVASYVQLHQSEFVRFAASLAGSRLPIPSHDTYLWYVANRFSKPIMRHNFKRYRGMTNKSDIDSLRLLLAEVETTGKVQSDMNGDDRD